MAALVPAIQTGNGKTWKLHSSAYRDTSDSLCLVFLLAAIGAEQRHMFECVATVVPRDQEPTQLRYDRGVWASVLTRPKKQHTRSQQPPGAFNKRDQTHTILGRTPK